MDDNYKYFAFISYNRKDEKSAKWLQHQLEDYRLPDTLKNREDLPQEFRPVFRDVNELKAGELPPQIIKALESSMHLIVVCSPRAVQSEWVNKEITDFIAIGNNKGVDNFKRIFTFIIDGAPDAQDEAQKCYPKALCDVLEKKQTNILGGNVNEDGRDSAFAKVLAGMLPGVDLNELRDHIEYEKAEAQRNKRNRIITAIVVTFLILTGVTFWMYIQRQQTSKANWQMMENKARFVAEEANRLMENDSYLARRLALEVLPKDMHNPDRPYTTEAERVLREACSHNSMILNNDIFNKPNSTCSLFSPDGNFIVTSYSDGVIRIWDAKTGTPIRTPLVGHTGSINSLAFSADGKMLVSASGDNTIRIWDFDTGRQIGDPLTGHTSGVSSASFSPDGHFIVSSGEDWTIRIWDVGNGQIIVPPLEGHLWGVNCVAYSPKGKYFASVSNDKTLRIWDAEKYECVRVLNEHKGSVFKVVYSPDGSKIATASMDRTVRIWDAETFECLDTLTGHRSWAQSVAFSSDGKLLVSTDGFARVWDVEKGSNYCKPFENDFFDYAAFSPDGNRLVATATDSKVLVWDIDRDDKPQILIEGIAEPNEISYPITSLIIPVDSKHIVVEHFDETIEWDLETGEQLCQPLNGYIKSVSANGKRLLLYSKKNKIARVWDTEKTSYIGGTFDTEEITLSPDGNYVVFVSKDENSNFVMKVCDIDSETELFSINDNDNDDLCVGCIHDFVFSPDGRFVFSRIFMDGVRIWDIAEKRVSVRLKGEMCYDSYNLPFFSPDGKFVIATDRSVDSIHVQIWSAETGTLIWKTSYHEDYDISISPNCKRLIVDYSNDGRIIDIVDITDGSIIRKLKARNGSSYTFDSKGDVLITDGSELIIVNTITGEYIKKSRENHGGDVGGSGFIVNIEAGRIFKTIGDGFHDVAISPNEKYYAYASGANVSVRDIETGKVIKSYEGDYDDVYSVTFTPNGKKIISTYQNGTIHIWDFPSLQDLIDQTRERFKDRPLTAEERKMYYLE